MRGSGSLACQGAGTQRQRTRTELSLFSGTQTMLAHIYIKNLVSKGESDSRSDEQAGARPWWFFLALF